MGNRFVIGAVVAAGVLGAAACAADGGFTDDDAGVINYTPSDATASKDGNVDAKADAAIPVTPDSGTGDAKADAGPDTGKPLDGGDGGAKDGGDAGDGGVTCNATNSCSSATSIGTVSGDKGADIVTKTGYLSAWYKIDVTEDDSSWFTAQDLSAQFALGSPVGSNYDLYVYDGCNTLMNQSTNLTGTDSVSTTWLDQRPAHDDTKTLYVYVKYVGGDCKATSPWSLQVRGNYP